MWDCKHRRTNDYCYRRKTTCYPGGVRCVLKGKFVFPLRKDDDPLIRNKRENKRVRKEN